jgi:hypothetical protein
VKYTPPAHKRPTHHIPDLVKAVGYTTGPDDHLIRDPAFRGRRQPQLIECKCSTDGNTQEVIYHIYTNYEILKQALQIHGTINADVIIIPIVISMTETFNVKTLAEIAQLISFKEEPPDALTCKQLPRPAKNSHNGPTHTRRRMAITHLRNLTKDPHHTNEPRI